LRLLYQVDVHATMAAKCELGASVLGEVGQHLYLIAFFDSPIHRPPWFVANRILHRHNLVHLIRSVIHLLNFDEPRLRTLNFGAARPFFHLARKMDQVRVEYSFERSYVLGWNVGSIGVLHRPQDGFRFLQLLASGLQARNPLDGKKRPIRDFHNVESGQKCSSPRCDCVAVYDKQSPFSAQSQSSYIRCLKRNCTTDFP